MTSIQGQFPEELAGQIGNERQQLPKVWGSAITKNFDMMMSAV